MGGGRYFEPQNIGGKVQPRAKSIAWFLKVKMYHILSKCTKDGQQIPDMSDEKIMEISNRYIELFEQITGEQFVKATTKDVLNRIEKNVLDFLSK